MAQNALSQIGAAIVLPVTLNFQGQFRIRSIEIDNGTAATILLGPDTGGSFVTVPAYQTRTYSGIDWGGYQLVNVFGTVIQSSDILNVIASDLANVSNQASAYGPASWGGGAVPNSLVPVLGGQQFLAWQVQQIINLLTGVMTAQNVELAQNLRVHGLIHVTGGSTFDNGLTVAGNLFAQGLNVTPAPVSGHNVDSTLQIPIGVNGLTYYLRLYT